MNTAEIKKDTNYLEKKKNIQDSKWILAYTIFFNKKASVSAIKKELLRMLAEIQRGNQKFCYCWKECECNDPSIRISLEHALIQFEDAGIMNTGWSGEGFMEYPHYSLTPKGISFLRNVWPSVKESIKPPEDFVDLVETNIGK